MPDKDEERFNAVEWAREVKARLEAEQRPPWTRERLRAEAEALGARLVEARSRRRAGVRRG